MNEQPQSIGSDQHDLDDELTRLEWQASQGQLTAQDNQRLDRLRQERQKLVRDVQRRVAAPDPGNPVVSGDDSP